MDSKSANKEHQPRIQYKREHTAKKKTLDIGGFFACESTASTSVASASSWQYSLIILLHTISIASSLRWLG